MAEKGQERSFPVDLETLLRDEVVELEYFLAERDIDGRFELCAGKPTIFVNTRGRATNYPRVRFTLAHEMGHFFLHRGLLNTRGPFRDDRITLDRDAHIEQVERDANDFAIELLLPRRVLAERFRRMRLADLDFIEELATDGGVSLQATAIRVARRTTNRLCVLLVQAGRVRWAVPSDAWYESRLPSGKLKGLPLPPESVSARKTDDFREERLPLRAWAPNQSWKDEDLYESAKSTSFGRLVFLGAEEPDEDEEGY